MKKIAHLTLFTGHLRNSPRSEVHWDTIKFLRPYVLGASGEIGDTGWTVRMVEGITQGSCGFTLHHSGLWLLSCFMAWTTAADNPMWGVVEKVSKTSVPKPDLVPWLAIHAMPDFFWFTDPHAIMEAADLERCIAWTVIETMAGHSTRAI
ncbi:hypothetical protein ASF69_01715 [Rhizobium sp. Leaf311]|uniref:hypothetical protein n=1 Tax=Rhizobium sp. Leaf311 TaxID=1736332 RepID=UPI0007153394|nr:hypothetical protein [Rhizobium sp. Leaf311]KQQ61167.1 hypothetical protein ASF69_01715 [Rhizobium sp. Leaf311]